jgi:hypothetical protein
MNELLGRGKTPVQALHDDNKEVYRAWDLEKQYYKFMTGQEQSDDHTRGVRRRSEERSVKSPQTACKVVFGITQTHCLESGTTTEEPISEIEQESRPRKKRASSTIQGVQGEAAQPCHNVTRASFRANTSKSMRGIPNDCACATSFEKVVGVWLPLCCEHKCTGKKRFQEMLLSGDTVTTREKPSLVTRGAITSSGQVVFDGKVWEWETRGAAVFQRGGGDPFRWLNIHQKNAHWILSPKCATYTLPAFPAASRQPGF